MKKSLLLFLVLTCCVLFVQAQSYYVSHLGNDANSGTFDRPFRTIQKALNTARSGSIFVRGGVYAERLIWQYSGQPAAPITLAAYSDKELVIVDGSLQASSNSSLLQIFDKSHVLVRGITFQNNFRPGAKGIFIAGTGTNVRIRNCVVTQIGWTSNPSLTPGLNDNANGILILGNKPQAYTNVVVEYTAIRHCQTGRSEGLTIAGNVDGFRIEYNWVHNITNIGIDAAGHYAWTQAPANLNQARNGVIRYNKVFGCIFPGNQIVTSGIYADGSRDIVIEQNHCYNNSVGISVGCENANKTASNVIVRSNFVYNNLSSGIYFGANGKDSRIEKCFLYNNTLFRNASDSGWRGEIHLQNSFMCHIFHNIISTRNGKKGIIALKGFNVVSPNIWFNLYHNESNDPNNSEFDWNGTWYPSLSSFQQVTGLDNSSRFANPQFLSIDPISPNLHIASTSLARDAGNSAHFPASGELDIDGQPRRAGTRTDIGADEIPATLAKLSSSIDSGLQVNIFPNPVKDRLFISNLPDNLGALLLIDLQGRPLKTFNAPVAQTEINVQDLPAGMYFLQISTPDATTLYQIIKE